jgi:hypothetical protein
MSLSETPHRFGELLLFVGVVEIHRASPSNSLVKPITS